MRTLLLTLVLVIATACYAEEHVAEESGDVLEQERTSSDSISAVEVDESTGRENPYAKYREAEEREKYPWMIVLVDADGEFIDFQDMNISTPMPV